MPRPMPPLAAHFNSVAEASVDLARAGDLVLAAAGSHPVVRRELRRSRREALYEVAFLRVVIGWEDFLEESFTRLIVGYQLPPPGLTVPGMPYQLRNPAYPTLDAARVAILAGQPYVSWANPTSVINRSKQFVTNGPHELVVASSRARLGFFVDIRNRIAHSSDSAKRRFDLATMQLVGRRYPSPGAFLRDLDPVAVGSQRLLTSISDELVWLAQQIGP